MTLGSAKAIASNVPMPRSIISAIVVSVGGLAFFLFLASWVLISNPGEHSRKLGVAFLDNNQTRSLVPGEKYIEHNKYQNVISEKVSTGSGATDGLEQVPTSSSIDSSLGLEPTVWSNSPNSTNSSELGIMTTKIDSMSALKPGTWSDSTNGTETLEIDSSTERGATSQFNSINDTNTFKMPKHAFVASLNDSKTVDNSSAPASSGSKINTITPDLDLLNQMEKVDSGSCDLYHGKWFYDPSGPLYTNSTCPIITQMQNCQGNGRPDKEYENWRWKPAQCNLPRFDGRKFLDLMKGKTLAFIGDSVARNQMESMLCILWQVEAPKNRGSRRMQRWYFQSTSVSIVRIWSSWLVHKTSVPFRWAPEGVDKLHLDAPDEDFMEFIPRFDVVVLSSGHWFAKQSVYILDKEIAGGQLWWPDKTRQMKVNNVEAFGISVETILTAMVTHPNYTGLTIVRSFSPDHYEGGAWNTGGSCTGKVQPAVEGELVKNEFTEVMLAKQVAGFEKAIKKTSNTSKLRLMNITEVFGFRHDGHPGPYRSPDPNKKTKRGPNGEPPPQDCLHWCMPGPVDTWNELVLEIIRREFEGD